MKKYYAKKDASTSKIATNPIPVVLGRWEGGKDVRAEPDRARPTDAAAPAEPPTPRRHQDRAREALLGQGNADVGSV